MKSVVQKVKHYNIIKISFNTLKKFILFGLVNTQRNITECTKPNRWVKNLIFFICALYVCVFYDISVILEHKHTAIFFCRNDDLNKPPDFCANVDHMSSWDCEEGLCIPSWHFTGKIKQTCKERESRNERFIAFNGTEANKG